MSIEWTIEDESNRNPLGLTDSSFDLKLEYKIWPGEKRTYEYPGSPAEIEILDVQIIAVFDQSYEPIDLDNDEKLFLKTWIEEILSSGKERQNLEDYIWVKEEDIYE